jgi:hypothetical protein
MKVKEYHRDRQNTLQVKLFFMNKLCNILQGEGDTTIQPFRALIMMA